LSEIPDSILNLNLKVFEDSLQKNCENIYDDYEYL